MAQNKQLTVNVRVNTKSAENSLRRLSRMFNQLNGTMSRIGNSNNNVNRQLQNSNRQANTIVSRIRAWATAQRQVNSTTRSTNSLLGSIGSKLKGIAATYLGIMGAKAVIGTSDTITSAKNKLNYISAQQLGSGGLTADGSGYSEATFKESQEAMDKMYTSAQKVRMSYTDMMTNVSKSMTLAGDAFQNNTDNAIRFQEIMSEAYTIGGASAQEMSSSMYQLQQALGAGTLAGDELRSVREGAPLAYKEIEKFAQKVLNCNDSLKEMGADGKITSDLVVAAIMNAGDKIDSAFEKTEMTFGQAMNKIKNAAIRAFMPISNKLSETLNKVAESGVFEKIEGALFNISKVLQITFALISKGVQWVADNWSWLSQVIVFALIVIAIYFSYTAGASLIAAISAATAWLIVNWQLVLIIGVIALVIYAFYSLANGASVVGKIILTILSAIGIAMAVILFPKFIAWLSYLLFAAKYYMYVGAQALAAGIKAMIGWMAANWVLLLVILVIVAVVAAVIWLSDSFADACGMIVGGIMAAIAFVWNLFLGIVDFILGCFSHLHNKIAAFVNFFANVFTDPIGSIIHLFGDMADCVLGMLQTIARGIDKVFGSDLAGKVQGWRDSLSGKVEVWAEEHGNGKYEKVMDEVDWSSESLGLGRWAYSDAYDTGYKWGEAGGNWITDKVSGLGDMLSLDGIGNKLGLDFGTQAEMFPNIPLDPTSNEDLLAGIKDDTGNISDSMDLNDDELEFLRKVAEMEWRNEFTTAEIKVDMTNNNTVNGERDLDGIVEHLSNVLREEMTSVAYGVHY